MIVRRETKMGSNDLNTVYRPCRVDEILGNETNKKIIRNALDSNKVHHTQLFTGDAGCGKTTAAKIVALGLNCETAGISSVPCLTCNTCKSLLEGNNIDVKEINVGQTGGKDYVDMIIRDLAMAPFNSRFKVIIFDEAHKLTDAAKDLLLTPTEQGFDHVYFIFCTNQPEKLRAKVKRGDEPFLGRCFTLNFGRISVDLIKDLLKNICEFEGYPSNEEVLELIAEESKGVPRNAIMWLDKISVEGSWSTAAAKEMCSGVGFDENDPQVIELSRALNSGNFKQSIKIFDSIKTLPVETIRIIVTNYFVSCLKGSKKVGDGIRFSKILDVLLEPIYEQGKLAQYKWYNYMFKISDIVLSYKSKVRRS